MRTIRPLTGGPQQKLFMTRGAHVHGTNDPSACPVRNTGSKRWYDGRPNKNVNSSIGRTLGANEKPQVGCNLENGRGGAFSPKRENREIYALAG